MGTFGVVFVPEHVDRCLSLLRVGPNLDVVEELALQGLVESLNLAGGGG